MGRGEPSSDVSMGKKQPSPAKHRRGQKESQDRADAVRERVTPGRQSNGQDFFVRAALGFLNVEVDTGFTLARIATLREDAGARAREIREARKAYDSVIKFLRLAAYANTEELEMLNRRIAGLRELLESLGEKF